MLSSFRRFRRSLRRSGQSVDEAFRFDGQNSRPEGRLDSEFLHLSGFGGHNSNADLGKNERIRGCERVKRYGGFNKVGRMCNAKSGGVLSSLAVSAVAFGRKRHNITAGRFGIRDSAETPNAGGAPRNSLTPHDRETGIPDNVLQTRY